MTRERTDILPDREQRRGEMTNVSLIVCQRCFDETAERIRDNSGGYTVGQYGEQAKRLGWCVIAGRWFCPPCAEQVRDYIMEPLP